LEKLEKAAGVVQLLSHPPQGEQAAMAQHTPCPGAFLGTWLALALGSWWLSGIS
jgi:hypothetical protein